MSDRPAGPPPPPRPEDEPDDNASQADASSGGWRTPAPKPDRDKRPDTGPAEEEVHEDVDVGPDEVEYEGEMPEGVVPGGTPPPLVWPSHVEGKPVTAAGQWEQRYTGEGVGRDDGAPQVDADEDHDSDAPDGETPPQPATPRQPSQPPANEPPAPAHRQKPEPAAPDGGTDGKPAPKPGAKTGAGKTGAGKTGAGTGASGGPGGVLGDPASAKGVDISGGKVPGGLDPRELKPDMSEVADAEGGTAKAGAAGAAVGEKAVGKGARGAAGYYSGGMTEKVPLVGKAIEKVGGVVGKAGGRLIGTTIGRMVTVAMVLFAMLLGSIGFAVLTVVDAQQSTYQVDAIDASEFAESDIPPEWLARYRAAGRKHDVPWTVLAAVGSLASDHGQLSPYDGCLRDPGRGTSRVGAGLNGPVTCEFDPEGNPLTGRLDEALLGLLPTDALVVPVRRDPIFPPIGDPSRNQGLGPLLLQPAALIEAGYDPDACHVFATEIEAAVADDEFEIPRPQVPCRLDPQDPDVAIDFLAERLAESRDTIIEEGFDYSPDATTNDSRFSKIVRTINPFTEVSDEQARGIDAFWEEAVNRLPLVDPATTGSAECNRPEGELLSTDAVAIYIQAAVRCEILTGGEENLPRNVRMLERDGEDLTELTVGQLTQKLAEQALDVSWRWSRWGSVGCDATPMPEPRPTGEEDEYDPEATPSVCEPKVVIDAAVQAVLDRNEQMVAAGTFDKALAGDVAFERVQHAGWDALVWVRGNDEERARYLERGSYRPWSSSAACQELAQDTVRANLDNFEIFGTVQDAGPAGEIGMDARRRDQLDEILGTVYETDPACVRPRAPAPGEWYVAASGALDQVAISIADAASGDAHDHDGEPADEPTGDTPATEPAGTEAPAQASMVGLAGALPLAAEDPGTDVSDTFEGLGQAELSELYDQLHRAATFSGRLDTSVSFESGTHAALATLSSHNVAYPYSPAPPTAGLTRKVTVGRQVIAKAREYGGLFDGDARGPGADSGSVSGLPSGAFGIPLVIDRDDYSQWEFHEDAAMQPLGDCGSPSNTSHQARSHVQRLWQTMCQDAAAQGITLRVNSSYRSFEHQSRLYQAYLNGTGNLAAAPGRSNHERGIALDVSIDGDPDKHWFHDIVGCFDQETNRYQTLSGAQNYQIYAFGGAERCAAGDLPIKRVQTYGFVPLCKGYGDQLADPGVINCDYSDGKRENWHLEPGKQMGVFLGAYNGNVDCSDPTARPKVDAAMTVEQTIVEVFRCRLTQAGIPDTQQQTIVAEALATSWHESAGFKTDVKNYSGSSAVGLFQFLKQSGDSWIDGGHANATDPVANTDAAARYFLARSAQYDNDYRYGWLPWAAVWPVAREWVETGTDAANRNSSAEHTVLYTFTTEHRDGVNGVRDYWVPNGRKDISRWEGVAASLWSSPQVGTSATPGANGAACPVGQPNNFSDTWHAPRSGGRQHKGVDILADFDIPVYAIQPGTVDVPSPGKLAGNWVIIKADDGTSFYYMHLKTIQVSDGDTVTVGQQIGTNGDTGNAAGTPHVHFEMHPGGGGAVNPTSYVRSACS